MIRVIFAIFAIIIKNLKLHYRNKNIPIRKNAIRFKQYIQKSEPDKYLSCLTVLFFNNTLTLIIILKSIYLAWKAMRQHIFPMSRSYSVNLQKIDHQVRSWEKVGEIKDLGNS